MLTSLLVLTALAATPDTAVGSQADSPGVRAPSRADRKVKVEVSFRSRWMGAPRGLVSAFGLEDDTDDYPWPLREDSPYCRNRPGDVDDPARACGKRRPGIGGVAYGFETLLSWPERQDTMLVYLDWLGAPFSHGYWDDRERGDDPDNPDDGDYLVPGRNFGALLVGIDYQREVPLVRPERTGRVFAMDFTVGAGAGLAVLVGRLDRYKDDAREAAYEKYDDGKPPEAETDLNRVWPAVDLNLGFKFTFADRVTLRLEGGLHTLLYAGGTLGFRF